MMKPKYIGKFLALALAGLTLNACLDYDVTGAEFNQNQKNEDKNKNDQ